MGAIHIAYGELTSQ